MYTEIKNPQWANAEHTMINCDVNFNHLSEEFVPFTAVASGDTEYAHEIYARCLAGEFGDVAEYVAPVIQAPVEPTKEQLMAELQALTAKIQALGA